METLQIVTVSNDNYAKHTAVLLTSLLENKKSNNPINIYIIGSISEGNKSNLKESVKRFGIGITFFSIDPALFQNFKLTKHFKQEVYYRLLIPQLLESTINKAIYLDSDMIIRDDITQLWDINIDDYFLAASRKSYLKRKQKELSIPNEFGYFNSGVMVINLSKWRENNVYQLVIDYLINNESKIDYVDQDGLNGVLYDKYLNFDKRWNLTTGDLKRLKNKKINPSIIHFSGKDKPWKNGHKYQNEYFKYLNLTIWNEND
ncbi:glycosyltransferase family 8 protein [Neobacillus sp. 179-C4.2 HS]|uniref:Glycosyltransferase family 8 protein n=1 Tax=Neobacillus driksii TaxID=3035913 RepID=A0ABV4YPT9_9BACI|nr:glycosyltransferase family 8 protein [Neobacillus sp. 179.-C4.2 HS]MDP5195477.1 glycosyltransferase family 8 protein [Neobacillus sp. 179.-C4.2 HS]